MNNGNLTPCSTVKVDNNIVASPSIKQDMVILRLAEGKLTQMIPFLKNRTITIQKFIIDIQQHPKKIP